MKIDSLGIPSGNICAAFKPFLHDKLVFAEMFWKSWNYSVGEPFMAPGGEMFRYLQHFGENVLPRGSHEWLPYSVKRSGQ